MGNDLARAQAVGSPMRNRNAIAAVSLLVLFFAVGLQAQGRQSDATLAPELSGLGTVHFPVTTSSPAAQRFIDQGVRLLYAFNHPEALRAFREAARLDPDAGDGVLGPGDGARAEPQRADVGRERPARLRGDRTDARDLQRAAQRRERALVDALARALRRRRRAGTEPSSIAPTPRRCAKVAGTLSARSGGPDVLRRRGDEHDAVGLLAEGRVRQSRRRRP